MAIWLIPLITSFIFLYCVYQNGSLAGLFSERAGVANIAIEGNMIIGAMLFLAFFTKLSGLELPRNLNLIISLFASSLLAGFYMWLLHLVTSKYMGDQIIVGTGLNLLAPALSIFVWIFFIDDKESVNWMFADWKYTTSGGVDFNKLCIWCLVITVVIVAVSWVYINKTKQGLRLKSSGENPFSLETAGVSVNRTRMKALYIAGVLSALAGAMFSMQMTSFKFTVNGSGFLALGVLIMAQWKVEGTIISSMILALCISVFNNITKTKLDIDEYKNIMNAIPFLIPIIGLIFFKSSLAPKTVGQNFKKDQR